MPTETIKVRIIAEELESWYRGRIGDVFVVEKETELNYQRNAVYKIHPDNGKLILTTNCVPVTPIDEYPTLVKTYE